MNGWLLDTNVVSELARAGANAKVVAWAGEQDERRLFLSILTLGEYDKGVHDLAEDSSARARIEAAVAALAARFAGRVLPVSDAIVQRWGRISGAVQRSTGPAAAGDRYASCRHGNPTRPLLGDPKRQGRAGIGARPCSIHGMTTR